MTDSDPADRRRGSAEALVMQDSGYRIVQLHPTLSCNLACLHCYSSSLPGYRGGLTVDRLRRFLSEARDDGFNVVSLSGGEPLSYPHLPELLHFTRSLGFQNNVVSNAMLAPGARAAKSLDLIDVMAISIDGPPAFHDEIRHQPGAFARMEQGLAVVKERVPRFGFIHTITSQTPEHLMWVVDFVRSHRGGLLQLHPLELSGRAAEAAAHLAPDTETLEKIYIAAILMQQYYGADFYVQIDLLHRDLAALQPGLVYRDFAAGAAGKQRVSELLRQVCVTEDGWILPHGYGIHRAYALGQLASDGDPGPWRRRLFESLIEPLDALFARAYGYMTSPDHPDIVPWNDLLHRASHGALDRAAPQSALSVE